VSASLRSDLYSHQTGFLYSHRRNTQNRPVLEESLEAIRGVIAEDLAQFKQTAQWAHSRAESAIEEEVRRSASAMREELQRDLNSARLRAAEMSRVSCCI